MNFSVEITLTKQYYQDFYREWVSQKWLRRAEPYLAVALVAVFAVLHYLDTTNALGSVPYLFMLIGLSNLLRHFYTRRKWLRARLDSQLLNQTIRIEFGPNSLKSHSPFSHGEIMWTGIKSIKQSPNAIFILPENGISIYLPKSAFATAEQFSAVAHAKQPRG